MEKKSDAKYNAIIVLLICIFSLSYISLIFNNNLWTDEAYTVELVSGNSIWGIISGTANDVHPPLYYIIAKVFISIFGSSIQVYKIVSVIPMFLTMLMGLIFVTKWFGGRAGILFILFVNAIPCVLEYAVQVRMYSLAIFFVTLSSLMAYKVFECDNVRYYVALSIAVLCACYVHNFAMISVFFIFIILGILLLIKERKFPIKWFVSGISIAILYLPWLLVLYRQTTVRVDNYWIEPVTLETVLGYPNDIFGSRIPYSTAMFVIICLFALVASIVRLVRRHDKVSGFSILLMFVPILTATVGIVVSVLVTPFFIARYIIPCMGILAISLAVSYCHESNFSFCMLCVFLVIMYGNSYYTNYVDEYKSTHTQELLDYLDENMGENDVIVYNYSLYGFIYRCYFDDEKLSYIEDFDFNSDYENIWFFDSCNNNPNITDEMLTQYSLSKEFIASLGIEQNDFILYKITQIK
jgi:uncharacterized membrane protein